MATVQVPDSGTSSRKKEHLEAGKRRLEEFRKKKAAERAKKASASTSSQLHSVENHSSETDRVHQTDSDGAGTSDGVGQAIAEPSNIIINHDISTIEHVHDDVSFGKADIEHRFGEGEMLADGIPAELISTVHPQSVQDIDSSFSSHYGKEVSDDSDSYLKDFTVLNSATLYEGERKLRSSIGDLSSANNTSLWPSESKPKVSSFDTRSSSNNLLEQSQLLSRTNTRRSRPSFLDSINMPRVYSASGTSTEPEKADSCSSKVHPIDNVATSASQNTTISSFVPADNGVDLFRHGFNEHNIERKHEFRSPKQDEDFAALEQHIEDLTQEKFSLQRAIEASRTLAESLAAENSALTESYNQQGSVVQQLRSDMEKLQEEIKVQLVELESLKIEYTNAQLECNAADERAKLLASEVIGLEEKALRLRSSELKLERQLENSQAEISSFKKKIASLEKDRQDLHSTVDALQEEKKLLQFKLRKASASGKVADISTSSSNKRDISTSTEDLADTNEDTSSLETSTSFPLQPENRDFNLEDSSLYIPPDQMRMIQNINTLISELGLEKQELVQALSTESSQSSMLKELNEELSRKLEVQTQRLELLTAQSMANEIIPLRQTEFRIIDDNNSAYADEGDEVVERVLGWIMKLFPGGPSRRRTSKLL